MLSFFSTSKGKKYIQVMIRLAPFNSNRFPYITINNSSSELVPRHSHWQSIGSLSQTTKMPALVEVYVLMAYIGCTIVAMLAVGQTVAYFPPFKYFLWIPLLRYRNGTENWKFDYTENEVDILRSVNLCLSFGMAFYNATRYICNHDGRI